MDTHKLKEIQEKALADFIANNASDPNDAGNNERIAIAEIASYVTAYFIKELNLS